MATYEYINSVTVGSGGASEITFTSIPSTYTDLVVRISGRLNQTGTYDGLNLKFNNTTANSQSRTLNGNGSTLTSTAETSTYGTRYLGINISGSTASTFSNIDVYIPNYAGSTYKTASADTVVSNNGAATFLRFGAYLWSNTAAITSITIFNQDYTPSDAFVQHSTARLYGIKNS
jgi:hypothetical protein